MHMPGARYGLTLWRNPEASVVYSRTWRGSRSPILDLHLLRRSAILLQQSRIAVEARQWKKDPLQGVTTSWQATPGR